LVPPLNR